MTNLYNSSNRPKILFIHGLNNNAHCFHPMIRHFQEKGYETDLIILPGHGSDRDEAKDLKTALRFFDQSMKKMKDTPYYAVAFSHGALYFQLWLEKNLPYKPIKQVLLAPALYIHKQSLAERMVKFLPPFFILRSFSPKPFRRYQSLKVWEYKTLMDGMLTFQKLKNPLKLPTKVLIDPKDELVDAKKLQDELGDVVEMYPRDYLDKGLGSHHILFHPEYFHEVDWKNFTRKIESFFTKTK